MTGPTDLTEKAARGGNAIDRALTNGRSAFLGFLVKRLGNRADAEDVLQEFCLRVLARKDQLREADRLDAWLYGWLESHVALWPVRGRFLYNSLTTNETKQ